MARLRRLLPALPVALLAACADIPAGPSSDFAIARRRWQGAGIGTYQYDVQVLCFCVVERTRTVRVLVASGQPASLTYVDSATAADTAMFADVRTMDRLFATLQAILDRDPWRFEATYDPVLGYPLTVSVDEDRRTADEERVYRVTSFTTFQR